MESISGSCRGSSVVPLSCGFRSEDPQRRAGDEMTLKIEVVVHGRMDIREALRGSRPFKALHLALSSSYYLVRILGSIILPESLLMAARQLDVPEGSAIRGSASQASKPPKPPVVSASQASVAGPVWRSFLSRFHKLIGATRSKALLLSAHRRILCPPGPNQTARESPMHKASSRAAAVKHSTCHRASSRRRGARPSDGHPRSRWRRRRSLDCLARSIVRRRC